MAKPRKGSGKLPFFLQQAWARATVPLRHAPAQLDARPPHAVGLAAVLLALVPASWLVPNHYPPWTSAWSDGLALLALTLSALLVPDRLSLPRAWLLWVLAALASVLLQAALGIIVFGGDALMVSIYLAAFALALALGSWLGDLRSDPEGYRLTLLAAALALSAIASVGIALTQWTHALSLGIFGADLPSGGRPYGNLAQANHFSTAVFLGLCSMAVLFEQGRIGASALAIGGLFLTAGLVMAGSRTAWLQVLLTCALALWLGPRT